MARAVRQTRGSWIREIVDEDLDGGDHGDVGEVDPVGGVGEVALGGAALGDEGLEGSEAAVDEKDHHE